MVYRSRDREGKEYIARESLTVRFFYGTILGRLFVKLFSFRFFSKLIGLFLSSKFSIFIIKNFVKKNNIDLSVYEDKKYSSFNDFFTRQLKIKNFVLDKNAFISPADAKLICYEINDYSEFLIKNTFYKISDLLNNDLIYKDYIGGYALVFRLCADDYHRYIYVDNGIKGKNVFIPGVLNTVRPISLEHFNIYKKNCREYSVLSTENFGDLVQVEVGAVLIGKISNLHQEYIFKKGEEKGMFEFGGSTIVLLVKKGVINIDKDILDNSKENIETYVKCGSKIGKKS